MKFSLVIPVAPNRNAEILESIGKANFPKKDFEIIIEKGTNPSLNRNIGAKKSKGEIIAFLDDDAVIDKDLLKNAHDFFEKYPQIDIVGGPQLTPLDERGFAKISGYALSSKFGGWNVANRYGRKQLNLDADETYLTSAIMFCRKKVLDRIQFDPALFPGEDPKFITDAKKIGFKVAYSPDLIIYHRRRPAMFGLVKQIFNYGKTAPFKENISELTKKPFFLIPSLFLAYTVIVLMLFLARPDLTGRTIDVNLIRVGFKLGSLLFSPIMLYGFLNIAFSFYESLKNRDARAMLLLPFIFLAIHLSYGAGRISGHIKKLIHKKEKDV